MSIRDDSGAPRVAVNAAHLSRIAGSGRCADGAKSDSLRARELFFAGGLFLLQFCNRWVASRRNQHQPTMTANLHQEIRERLALARHARRMGKPNARRWHVQQALDARAELRNLPKP